MAYLYATLVISVILVGALGIAVGSMTQRALADKAAFDDNNKQGGLGEYYSKDGRNTYYGGESGQAFGDQVSTYAQPGDQAGGHESFGVKNAGDNSHTMLVVHATHNHVNRGLKKFIDSMTIWQLAFAW